MKKHVLVLALGLALIGAATEGTAEAAPPALAARMPAKSFADLKVQVTKARSVDPMSFARVSSIVTHAPEANARARGHKAATALTLAQLGPAALMPMLEMLAVDAPHGISEADAVGVRRDIIEAVGLLKKPEALPVLTTILADASEDVETTRTVTEAVARINTEESATQILAALNGSNGDRTRAILAGMGECRHLRVTEALAARLTATNDENTARAAARSLGRAGNAWAWKTLADHSEESSIRHAAATALVESYVKRTGDARQAASNALMVIDAPETPSLISDARRNASPEVTKALDALEARFARNPTRTN